MATNKGVLVQGTETWILHGTEPTLTQIKCFTSLDYGEDSATEIDSTCLDEPDTATSEWGLSTPGTGSIGINIDSRNKTHMLIMKLAAAKEVIGIYSGWSDGEGVPAISGDKVTMPNTRSWTYCDKVALRKTSPKFEKDSLVGHTITMKRQSEALDTYKGEEQE